MYDLLHKHKGLGGFENSRTAFQLELAVEELFFGRAICSSRQFASFLCVSSTNQNSLTRMRGFLSLGPIGIASVGESPPPLETWLKDDLQKVTDSLLAGPQVVGEELTKILLCDLYQRNDRLTVESLKGPDSPIGRLVDCRTVGEFCKEVCKRKAFEYPHTFGRALKMVTSLSYDPIHCLELGLSKFKFFTHIKYWDKNRNRKARWNFTDFVELHKPSEVP